MYEEAQEVDTRMTLKVRRLQRHSAGGNSDFLGMQSVDERVRFQKSLLALEEVRNTSRARTRSANYGVEMTDGEEDGGDLVNYI